MKSRSTFTGRRGPLYDVIDFQGSDVNGIGTLHRFYVHVGIGSTDLDTPGDGRPQLDSCLVRHRWESFAAGAPARVQILPDTDIDELAAALIGWQSFAGRIVDARGPAAHLVEADLRSDGPS